MHICPLCHAPLGRVLLAITSPDRFERAAGISPDGYLREWRECPGCRAAINCLPAESAERWRNLSTRYYEIDFGGSWLREKYDKVMALSADRSDNSGRVARIHGFLACLFGQEPGTSGGRVLDIGAGLGVFLSAFLRDGWKGMAIEPDPLAAAHLRSLEKFEVVEDIFRGQPGLRNFDLVTLNKVIEHIPEPQDLLGLAGAALAETGVLYVEVPDRETIGRRPVSDNILGSIHAHLHSPESLSRLLSDKGLFPLCVERVFEPSGKISLFAFATTKAGFDRMSSKGTSEK